MGITRSVIGWMRNSHGKSTDEIVRRLKYLHVDRVELKCADGNHRMITGRSQYYQGEPNVTRELVRAIRAEGIDVYGWMFNYGRDPAGELAAALAEIERFDLSGWVWDVESEFMKRKNAPDIMQTLGLGVATDFPDVRQGFCCFRYLHKPGKPSAPYWNREVWEVAERYCAEGLPMAYWSGTNVKTAGDQTVESILQWEEIFEARVFPMLRAWWATGGWIYPDWIPPLVERCTAAGAIGVTWWSLDKILTWPALYRSIANVYDDMDPNTARWPPGVHGS
jgi:hypothetical protein